MIKSTSFLLQNHGNGSIIAIAASHRYFRFQMPSGSARYDSETKRCHKRLRRRALSRRRKDAMPKLKASPRAHAPTETSSLNVLPLGGGHAKSRGNPLVPSPLPLTRPCHDLAHLLSCFVVGQGQTRSYQPGTWRQGRVGAGPLLHRLGAHPT